jgi:serine/threonine protein kinase
MTGAIRFCDTCGGVNRMGARFCAHCGTALIHTPDSVNTPGSSGASPSSYGLLPAGQMLKQRYRIVKRIGVGGFGAIYQAEDNFFNQALRAVKEMRMQHLDPQEAQQAIEGFKQEAILLAGLMHPNLPRIYDYFEDDGRWYLVMDYIEGDTLSIRLYQSQDGKLPLSQVLPWAIQLCTVLGYLHSRQPPIIFRDLKPSNVMITTDDHLYLIDFGIARLFKPGQVKDTLALGSPGYAAPEQYGKAQTTERSDLYSLGATLHYLLSGNDPGDDPFQFLPLDLDQFAPAGPAVAKLVMQMVEMKREHRPANALDVKQELQRLAQQLWHAGPSPFPKRTRRAKQASLPSAVVAASAQTMDTPVVVPATPPMMDDETLLAVPAPASIAPAPAFLPPPAASPSSPPRSAIAGLAKKKAGTTLLTFSDHQKAVLALSWLPDSLHIASGGGDGLLYWDVKKGQVAFSSSRYIHTLVASPDGASLAASSYGLWYLYTVPDGEDLFFADRLGTTKLDFKQNAIHALAWSPDGGYLAFGMEEGQVIIWDVRARQVYASSHPHSRRVTSLSWSPDSQYLASGSRDQRLCVQAVELDASLQGKQELLKIVFVYADYNNSILKIAWSPDGRYIALGGTGKATHVCNATSGDPIWRYQHHRSWVEALAWSPDSQYLATGSQDHAVHVCKIGTADPILTYTGHSDNVNALEWSPDGRMVVSASNDKTVQVWRAPFV